jgi:hypothetical protein
MNLLEGKFITSGLFPQQLGDRSYMIQVWENVSPAAGWSKRNDGPMGAMAGEPKREDPSNQPPLLGLFSAKEI